MRLLEESGYSEKPTRRKRLLGDFSEDLKHPRSSNFLGDFLLGTSDFLTGSSNSQDV
jgi:hypothetical protein